jgi:hypothetical protein
VIVVAKHDNSRRRTFEVRTTSNSDSDENATTTTKTNVSKATL